MTRHLRASGGDHAAGVTDQAVRAAQFATDQVGE
jgi:hypothetical protein